MFNPQMLMQLASIYRPQPQQGGLQPISGTPRQGFGPPSIAQAMEGMDKAGASLGGAVRKQFFNGQRPKLWGQ